MSEPFGAIWSSLEQFVGNERRLSPPGLLVTGDMNTFVSRRPPVNVQPIMRIALFGPPGAGKGTQASFLERDFDLKSVSTGNLIRSAIRAETQLGRMAESYVSSGELVPDKLVGDLANEAIAERAFRHFILDGYPRTLQQAVWLDSFLTAHAAPLDVVLSIDVPDDQIVQRLSHRRINAQTGESYHLDFRPPPADVDSSLIVQRSDDEPDRIRRRIDTYRRNTKPLEAHFERQGLLLRVSGIGPVEDVRVLIHEALADRLELQPSH